MSSLSGRGRGGGGLGGGGGAPTATRTVFLLSILQQILDIRLLPCDVNIGRGHWPLTDAAEKIARTMTDMHFNKPCVMNEKATTRT